MTVLAQTAAPRAQKTDGGLYDILDLILDRGLVIDVFIRVSVIGIEILRVDIRIVIASVDTYLRFAAATNRLDLENRGTPVVTPAPALFTPALPTAVASGAPSAVSPGVAAAPAPGTVVMQGQPVTAWQPGTGAAVPVVGNLGQTVGQAVGTVGQTVGGVVGAVTPTVGGLVQSVAPTVGGLVHSVAPSVGGVAGTAGQTAGTVVGAVAPTAATVVSAVAPAAGATVPVADPAVHSADATVQQVVDAPASTAARHEEDTTVAPDKTPGGKAKGQQDGKA
jgi:hypothetical protein